MVTVRSAQPADVPQILAFIRTLGDYEHLGSEVVATEEALRATLFGERAYAAVDIADCGGQSAGFALYFHSYEETRTFRPTCELRSAVEQERLWQ